MRSIAATVLFSSCLFVGAANAADGCGPGCHNTVGGACVVDGWESGAVRWNECPAGSQPRPPCYRPYVWDRRGKTCLRVD